MILKESPELETVCPKCTGQRGTVICDDWWPCRACGGSGYLPTEYGKRIISLIEHANKAKESRA